MEKNFSFNRVGKILCIALMAIGLLALVVAIAGQSIGPSRIWANVLLNNYMYLAIALFGTFFIVIHVLSDAAWHLSIQRVPEAMSTFLPVAALLMFVMLFGAHDIYHWTHTGHLDAILEAKTPYLNIPFFTVRMVVYFAGWILLAWLIRKHSVQHDLDADFSHIRRIRVLSGVFIVFFAITSSTSSWDWIMSVDSHWFSTLFGWYVFSSLFVSGISVTILLVLYLKRSGYMPHVNDEHLHDLGKYLFAFSIFWAYLWFSQYMLIWYSNIPEETVYYYQRLKEYQTLFFANIGINLLVPFLVLMTRNSKRQFATLAFVSVVCIAGHWLDYFLMVMPGILGGAAIIGWFEVCLTLGYAGLFLFVVLRALTKASLLPRNHPYLQEAFEYENIGG